MPAPRSKTLKRRATKAAVPAQTTKDTAADATPVDPEPRKKHYVQPAVLDAIRAGKGNPVTLKEMTEAIGCPEHSIQNAALKLMKSVPQIEAITKGQVWRWNDKVTDLARTEDKPQDYTIGDFGPVPQPPRPVSAVPVSAGAPLGVWYEVGHDAAGNPLVRKDGEQEIHRVEPL